MAWNRSNGEVNVPMRRFEGDRTLKLILACAVLVGIAGLIIYLVIDSSKGVSSKGRTEKKGFIKDVASTLVPKPAEKIRKQQTEAERIFSETNGMSIGALRQWEFKNWKGAVLTNRPNRRVTLEEKVFANGSDRMIAGLLLIEPGESMIGDSRMMFNKHFLEKFKRSLNEPIIVSDDDTQEVKELKQAVIETRNELKKRADAGEDICELLAQTRDEYKELGLYRKDVEEMVKSAMSDKDLSDTDINDCIAAANKMLADRGAKPIKMPTVYARALRMIRLRTEYINNQKGKE